MKFITKVQLLVVTLIVSSFVGCNTTKDLGLVNGVKDVTYTTVTEGFDWGPAITKVVIDFGSTIDKDSVSADIFSAKSIRTYKDFDWATGAMATEATPHEGDRVITAAYVSDSNGNEVKKGNYVTLEMAVSPATSEDSPYNYEFTSGFNVLVDTTYNITMSNPIMYKNGTEVTLGNQESAGNINLIADEFENNVKFKYGDIELGYASYTPENVGTEGTTPLIIWLHGAGEGGTNTLINIMGNKVVNLATPEIQQYFGETGAYVLAPQSPTMWMDADGTKTYNNSIPENSGTSYYTDALTALIKDYVAKNPSIDQDRIYIGGCSNGGYMTINMLMSNPGYFAAAYPAATPYMSYWLTEEKLNAIKDTPIWFTHAKTDATVQIMDGTPDPQNFMVFNLNYDEDGNTIPLDQHVNFLYNELTAAGATDVHYTLYDKVEDSTGNYFAADGTTPYEYMGHWSWIYTLNNEPTETINGEEVTLFQWLSQHTK